MPQFIEPHRGVEVCFINPDAIVSFGIVNDGQGRLTVTTTGGHSVFPASRKNILSVESSVGRQLPGWAANYTEDE